MKFTCLCGSIVVAILLSGCSSAIKDSIEQYEYAAEQVRIGMDKDEALKILLPTQEILPADEQRKPEIYTDANGQLVEIYFMRSQAYYDDILTDDEFTPYIFRDGKLSAIGWAAIGGPKTQAVPYQRGNFNMGFGYGYHRW